MMIPIWMLPIMVLALCLLGIAWAGYCCCAVAKRADRRAADEQELRDIDAWLEAVRKA